MVKVKQAADKWEEDDDPIPLLLRFGGVSMVEAKHLQ